MSEVGDRHEVPDNSLVDASVADPGLVDGPLEVGLKDRFFGWLNRSIGLRDGVDLGDAVDEGLLITADAIVNDVYTVANLSSRFARFWAILVFAGTCSDEASVPDFTLEEFVQSSCFGEDAPVFYQDLDEDNQRIIRVVYDNAEEILEDRLSTWDVDPPRDPFRVENVILCDLSDGNYYFGGKRFPLGDQSWHLLDRGRYHDFLEMSHFETRLEEGYSPFQESVTHELVHTVPSNPAFPSWLEEAFAERVTDPYNLNDSYPAYQHWYAAFIKAVPENRLAGAFYETLSEGEYRPGVLEELWGDLREYLLTQGVAEGEVDRAFQFLMDPDIEYYQFMYATYRLLMESENPDLWKEILEMDHLSFSGIEMEILLVEEIHGGIASRLGRRFSELVPKISPFQIFYFGYLFLLMLFSVVSNLSFAVVKRILARADSQSSS